MVWSPAVLAAEIEAELLPQDIVPALKSEGINSLEDIRLTARLQGYGRVLTASALTLVAVKEMCGRTLIRRKGLGVVASFLDKDNGIIAESPAS